MWVVSKHFLDFSTQIPRKCDDPIPPFSHIASLMNGESRAPTKLLVDVSYMLYCFGSLSELDFWVDSWQYQGQLKLVKFWQHQAHSPRENHYLIFSNFKLKIPKIGKITKPLRFSNWPLVRNRQQDQQGIILSSYRLWETLISWVMFGWNVCLTIHLSQEKSCQTGMDKNSKRW